MELKFIDSNGVSEIILSGDDLGALKAIASDKHAGEELMIWESGPTGKPSAEHAPDFPCVCRFEDGSYFSIA